VFLASGANLFEHGGDEEGGFAEALTYNIFYFRQMISPDWELDTDGGDAGSVGEDLGMVLNFGVDGERSLGEDFEKFFEKVSFDSNGN